MPHNPSQPTESAKIVPLPIVCDITNPAENLPLMHNLLYKQAGQAISSVMVMLVYIVIVRYQALDIYMI